MRTASIVEHISIADVLRIAGVAFKQRGPFARFLCPCHDDTRPSAFGGQYGWRCFACGARGGLLDLAVALGLAPNRAGAARYLEAKL